MTDVPEHLGGHLHKTHTDGGAISYIVRKWHPESFLDIGCGPGGMVAMAQNRGMKVTGIDGDFSLEPIWEQTLVRPNIVLHDFESGAPELPLEEYDVCWSVEFLEHVHAEFMPYYMECFQKAKVVVCTAAPPGTPGHHHVNCQLQKYWVEKFKEYGFQYDPQTTYEIIQASTMKKRFLERHGMVYVNESKFP
jgi:SAM-dependent methyltransferase